MAEHKEEKFSANSLHEILGIPWQFLRQLLTSLPKDGFINSQQLVSIHFWCHLIGGIGMGAFMGMAGLKGMLLRTLYFNGEFDLYMILAALAGALLLVAFLAFFTNIVLCGKPSYDTTK